MPRGRRPAPEDPKVAAPQAAAALHPHPAAVQDEAFARHEFFDRRDRVQVKYEMLRRHRVGKRPVTEVAAAFGVSRQAFYASEAAFAAGGLPGLLPVRAAPSRRTSAPTRFWTSWSISVRTIRRGRRRRWRQPCGSALASSSIRAR